MKTKNTSMNSAAKESPKKSMTAMKFVPKLGNSIKSKPKAIIIGILAGILLFGAGVYVGNQGLRVRRSVSEMTLRVEDGQLEWKNGGSWQTYGSVSELTDADPFVLAPALVASAAAGSKDVQQSIGTVPEEKKVASVSTYTARRSGKASTSSSSSATSSGSGSSSGDGEDIEWSDPVE